MSGKLGLLAPNHIKNTDIVPVFGGGDWNSYTLPDGTVRGSLENLAAEFFIEEAVSVTAASADSQFEIDFGQTLTGQGFFIPDGNAQSGGTIRLRTSTTIAWSGFTVNGAHVVNAVSLSVHNASGGSVTITSGQIFTLAGDSKVYQVTAGATIANGANGTLTIKRVDKTATGLAVAMAGSEAITCRSGDYTTPTLDTTALSYPQTATPTTGWSSLTLPNSFSYIAAASFSYRYAKVEIVNTGNTDGEITVQGMYIGPIQYPPYNMDYGARFGFKNNTQREGSPGGANSYDREQTQRTLQFQLSAIPEATIFTQFFDLLNETGIDGDVWVFYDSSDTTLLRRRSFPANFDDLAEFLHALTDGLDVVLTMTERVA